MGGQLPDKSDHEIAERANVAWGAAIGGPHVAVLAAQMAREAELRRVVAWLRDHDRCPFGKSPSFYADAIEALEHRGRPE